MTGTVTLHTGRVLTAAPFENQYVVSTEVGVVTATALETGSGRRGGHTGGTTYVPGAVVLVAKISTTAEDANRVFFPNLILGGFHAYPTFESEDKPAEMQPVAAVSGSNADALRNPFYRTVLGNEPNTILNENRGGNRLLDGLPGDWYKSTVLGGLVLLSEFMTRIGIAPDCQLTFNGVDRIAEFISRNYCEDHGSQFRELLHRGSTPVDVTRFALDLAEGLGASTPFEPADEQGDSPWVLKPKDGQQTGLFRREDFNGAAADGQWAITRTTDPRSVHVFGAEIYPGMTSVMNRWDGIYRLRAAKEIKFEKTFGIVTPWLKQELRGAAPTENPPEPYTGTDTQFRMDLAQVSEDEVFALMPILHDRFATAEEAQLFFQGLKRDGDVWYFPTKAEVEAKVFPEETPKLKVLPADQQEYTLEDLVYKDAEVAPNRIVRLFKNSSVFLMSEDGGFVIGDGFGGEIRMNRGRVTISSAADIQMLPGRDLIEQIPGNRINRTGDRIEFSSTRGAVAVKAETNLQMSSGAGGGALVLENCSPDTGLAEVQDEALRQGLPAGSGIVIKARSSGVSLLGTRIYGGGYAEGKSSTSGVAPAPCRIMFDAGTSEMLLHGGSAVLSFKDSVAMTMQDRATGLYLAGSDILSISQTMSMVTGSVLVDKGVGRVPRPVLTAARIDESRKDALPTTAPVLEVGGAILSRTGLFTKGDVGAEGGIASNRGANPLPITDPIQRVRVDLGMDQLPRSRYAETATAAAAITLGVLQDMVSYGIATERGQKITEFAFPDSESPAYRAKAYTLVAPRWQSMLADTAKTWIEKAVDHAILEKTYPYPGRTVYEADNVLVSPSGTGVVRQSMQDYRVNI